VLAVEGLVFSLAIVILLYALYVHYRDIAYIWEVVVQMMFYATPIIYPLILVPEAVRPFLLLSPLAQIIQDARDVLVTPQTTTLSSIISLEAMLIPFVFIAALGVVAVWYFRRKAPYFAEEM
jgi:ABC-2 type transport system permease protein